MCAFVPKPGMTAGTGGCAARSDAHSVAGVDAKPSGSEVSESMEMATVGLLTGHRPGQRVTVGKRRAENARSRLQNEVN